MGIGENIFETIIAFCFIKSEKDEKMLGDS
jgi:hypothetical protein